MILISVYDRFWAAESKNGPLSLLGRGRVPSTRKGHAGHALKHCSPPLLPHLPHSGPLRPKGQRECDPPCDTHRAGVPKVIQLPERSGSGAFVCPLYPRTPASGKRAGRATGILGIEKQPRKKSAMTRNACVTEASGVSRKATRLHPPVAVVGSEHTWWMLHTTV